MNQQTDLPPAGNPDESRLDLGRLLPIGALVLVVGFGGFAYLKSLQEAENAESRLAEQTNQNMELQKQMANLQTVMEDLKTAKVYEEQEKSISQVNSMAVIEQGELVSAQIDLLSQKQSALSKRISELEKGDVGRKIAASPKLVAEYNAALDVTLPGPTICSSLSSRLDRLMIAPAKAIDEKVGGYVPSDALQSSLASIESQVSDALAALDRVSSDIEAIVQQAQSLQPNESQTLAQAISILSEAQDAKRRELVRGQVEQAKKEAAEKLAAQEAENRAKIAEAERKAAEMVGDETASKILADAKSIKAEIDAAKAVRAAAEAKAQLVREYNRELPQVKQYLQAFLADGRKLRTAGSGPASLSYLVGKGALTPSNTGLEELLSLGSYYNDRPRGALPEFFYFNSVNVTGKNDKIAAIEKAQQFLIKFGELMVENGTLAK